jgi:hypothetical protein|tara:strand:- start:999 stop:1223 length:225 start_codon:yes stop_codon:yes gene_type:complete
MSEKTLDPTVREIVDFINERGPLVCFHCEVQQKTIVALKRHIGACVVMQRQKRAAAQAVRMSEVTIAQRIGEYR